LSVNRIDDALRERVAAEAANLDQAFNAALKNETTQSLEDLANAADRLMRAAGRILIEVRKEA
jgi:hypothetical protein